MKVHMSLATADLESSIRYYSVLLSAAPAKHYDDYALFLTDDPALELALTVGQAIPREAASHFGLAVESVDAVEGAAERLKSAEIPVALEREEVCCYAKQTKVWSSDPDGRRWEVYTVHEETAQREDAANCCSGGL